MSAPKCRAWPRRFKRGQLAWRLELQTQSLGESRHWNERHLFPLPKQGASSLANTGGLQFPDCIKGKVVPCLVIPEALVVGDH